MKQSFPIYFIDLKNSVLLLSDLKQQSIIQDSKFDNLTRKLSFLEQLRLILTIKDYRY